MLLATSSDFIAILVPSSWLYEITNDIIRILEDYIIMMAFIFEVVVTPFE